jgi:hypothetical protein
MVGAGFAGIGNGVEAVSARTALQEATQERWMALMMSLNESMFQLVPGAGIVLGGALAALASPRSALAVAGAGSLAVTAFAWLALAGLNMTAQSSDDAGESRSGGLDGSEGQGPDVGASGANGGASGANGAGSGANGGHPGSIGGVQPDGGTAPAPASPHQ